jgi:glutaredoxin 3
MKIRLFIKPYCGWCDQAMRWLDDHGIAYEKIDVIADDVAFAEMFHLSGQELAPVLDVDDKVLADFGPEELPGFFKTISTTDKHGFCFAGRTRHSVRPAFCQQTFGRQRTGRPVVLIYLCASVLIRV